MNGESDVGTPSRAGMRTDVAAALAAAGAAMLALAAIAVSLPLAMSAAMCATSLTALYLAWHMSAHSGDGIAETDNRTETAADRAWEQVENEANYGLLIDALGDLVVHRDQEGTILFANAAFLELCGTSLQEIRGRTFAELQTEVTESSENGRPMLAVEAGDGKRWFEWTTITVRDRMLGTIQLQSIGRDVTRQLLVEETLEDARRKAEQASTAKSRFLAMVSHEIRTPMNGIVGMSKLMADTGLTAEQQTYNEAIANSGSSLLALIDNLLDFSMIEAGRFEPQTADTDPRLLVENVVELLAMKAYDKGIGLGCHVARNVPATIGTDGGRLRQVLLNLVGNAIKFTDKGGILVSVQVRPDGDGRKLVFSVSDSGPGIRDADRARIFGEFEQADLSTTRRHGGAGLGLAISRDIMAALGGTLELVSSSPRGTRFEACLPLAAGTVLPAVPRRLRGMTIAISVPSRQEEQALAAIIRDHGGHVIRAGLPGKAASANADVLLAAPSDGESHAAFTKRVRRLSARGMRRVLMVRPSERNRLARMHDDGFDAFLARPVRRETLLRVAIGEQGPATAKETRPVSDVKRRAGQAVLPRILVAEDNPVNALLVRKALERHGFAVDVAVNGRDAVNRACADASRYGLVLMDLHMPELDGADAIAAIRRHEEEHGLRPVPIHALTADNQEETRTAMLAHGANGHLTKPVDPETLANLAKSAIAA